MGERMAKHLRCPPGWERTSHAWFQHRFRSPDGLLVITTQDTEPDTGRSWLHVSFSRSDRMPTYDDLQLVREHFIGTDRLCLQVFPREEHYVNLHPHCLHLWCPEFELLPDRIVEWMAAGVGPTQRQRT